MLTLVLIAQLYQVTPAEGIDIGETSRRATVKLGRDVVAYDRNGEVIVVCAPPANAAIAGETLEQRIARLETALRLSRAELKVNQQRRKR